MEIKAANQKLSGRSLKIGEIRWLFYTQAIFQGSYSKSTSLTLKITFKPLIETSKNEYLANLKLKSLSQM